MNLKNFVFTVAVAAVSASASWLYFDYSAKNAAGGAAGGVAGAVSNVAADAAAGGKSAEVGKPAVLPTPEKDGRQVVVGAVAGANGNAGGGQKAVSAGVSGAEAAKQSKVGAASSSAVAVAGGAKSSTAEKSSAVKQVSSSANGAKQGAKVAQKSAIIEQKIEDNKVITTTAKAKIVTYPAPNTEKIQLGYSVFVNGVPVDVYKSSSRDSSRWDGNEGLHGGGYYYAYFDFHGEVEVEVKSRGMTKKDIELFPARKFVVSGFNGVKFKADKPFKTCVLRDERNRPLMIFGNPLEKNAPKQGDPNVVYFGAGVHAQPRIELTDNQTLYIAGGAVVKSILVAKGKNITVRGRGILSGELTERQSANALARFTECQNLKINGVILTEPPLWTLDMRDCENVDINNIKICSGRMLNDDAVDICDTKNVKIRNSFMRCQDDVIALKALTGNIPVENISIKKCVFWTDRANIFRIGFECNAPYMKKLTVRDCDVAFYATDYAKPDEWWVKAIFLIQPANDMVMSNFRFENINIRSNGRDMIVVCGNPRITYLKKTWCYQGKNVSGKIRDCLFKNITVSGKRGKFKGLLHFKGYDAAHDIRNIRFENITYFGEKITKDSPCVNILEHASNITF